jgi:hypothetical protein
VQTYQGGSDHSSAGDAFSSKKQHVLVLNISRLRTDKKAFYAGYFEILIGPKAYASYLDVLKKRVKATKDAEMMLLS